MSEHHTDRYAPCSHAYISEARGRRITVLKAQLRVMEDAYNRLWWQYQDIRKAVDGAAARQMPSRPQEVQNLVDAVEAHSQDLSAPN